MLPIATTPGRVPQPGEPALKEIRSQPADQILVACASASIRSIGSGAIVRTKIPIRARAGFRRRLVRRARASGPIAKANAFSASRAVVRRVHDRFGTRRPIAKIPDSIGEPSRAADGGLTALAAIEALHVTKGMTLLVLGATGGVGGFAVQIAHGRGVRVIGTGRSSSDAFARSLGSMSSSRTTVRSLQAVKATHPDGIDAALDLVDDADAIKAMAQIVHAEGRIVSTVHSADVEWFARETISAQNIGLFGTPQFSHAGLRALLELLEQKRIRVVISAEHSLSDAVVALEESKRGAISGKLVITVD